MFSRATESLRSWRKHKNTTPFFGWNTPAEVASTKLTRDDRFMTCAELVNPFQLECLRPKKVPILQFAGHPKMRVDPDQRR